MSSPHSEVPPGYDAAYLQRYEATITALFMQKQKVMAVERHAHVQIPILAECLEEGPTRRDLHLNYTPPEIDPLRDVEALSANLLSNAVGLPQEDSPISSKASLRECLQQLDLTMYIPPRGTLSLERRLMMTIRI
jgi:hypothetical protein